MAKDDIQGFLDARAKLTEMRESLANLCRLQILGIFGSDAVTDVSVDINPHTYKLTSVQIVSRTGVRLTLSTSVFEDIRIEGGEFDVSNEIAQEITSLRKEMAQLNSKWHIFPP